MDKQSADRDDLAEFLAQLLEIARFRDYCPNGLQVEGKPEIRCIVSGVTACRALIEAAIDLQADALLVHHGYFWRDENPCVTGIKRGRLKPLLQNDISLFAYHLPLDHHPGLGNNAQLAKLLDLQPSARFGENDLGWLGTVPSALAQTVGELAALVELRLGRKPLLLGDPQARLGTVGWCSGAAQGLLAEAANAGASVFLSGEISEQTMHVAHEAGIAYLACGHHATERLGVQALGERIAARFGIRHQFVEIDNPA
ncbi:MAG: Nif3-like dinuclear metal center hexameric protein [Burkholderiaceae bacterium]|nr:Nif3-like dinuclear metal center hexameric protein [Burkholderiaceae bacterium]